MNIENTLFFAWMLWYFYTYGPPQLIYFYVSKIYIFLDGVFNKMNIVMYSDYWDCFSDISSDNCSGTTSEENIIKECEPTPKYEDKYLDIIRKINKEWQFTEDEIEEKESVSQDFYNNLVNNIKNDIDKLNLEINDYKKDINEDTNVVTYIETFNEYGDELVEEITLEERNEYRTEQINELNKKIDELSNKFCSDKGVNELKNEAEIQANEYIINKRIDKLKNCYIIEKTPQGNVLMMYDKERESFKYYSDSNIPYRYLEVVGRKYVKFFNCRPLFIDMEEELKLCDEKWTKEYELKKAKEAEEKLKAEEALKNNKPIEQKKNVFAKFKSYNKDAGGKISMAAPPKNSIPNKKQTETKEDEKILLKERANRYTYEGKFANFNFLQKIERKVFNKRLGISFADFKKMNN